MHRSNIPSLPAQHAWLAIFAVTVAFLGGSSRAEPVQLIALQPLSALLLIPALYYLSGANLRQVRVPMALAAMFGIWMVVQLIPLPPEIWQALPRRDVIVELDGATGLDGVWRPIAWAPTRAWGSVASLIVPLTAILLPLALGVSARILLLLIVAIGVVDAALGLLQVLSGPSSALYMYSPTNRGSAVGLFANENHSGVFSALVLLVIARLYATSREAVDHPVLQRLFYPAAFFLILISALIGGSRTGLALSILSLLAAVLMFSIAATRHRRTRQGGQLGRLLNASPRWVLVAFAAAILSLLGLFFAFGRAEGLEEIIARNPFEDLRVQLWPVLKEMMSTFWLLGAGFGSFDEVYHIFEPNDLLLPQYINQAHNDWAQIVIEGGIAAFAILVALLGWCLMSLRQILIGHQSSTVLAAFWLSAFAIISASSIVDYPLRTPIFQLIAIWLLLCLTDDREASQSGR